MDLLKAGLTWLHGVRSEKMTTPVTYTRAGDVDGEPMLATLGRFGGDVALESELEVNSLARDFIIDSEYFGTGAAFVPPAAGDRIEIDETGEVCEVAMMGADAVWRWSDPHRQAVRVHTTRIVI